MGRDLGGGETNFGNAQILNGGDFMSCSSSYMISMELASQKV